MPTYEYKCERCSRKFTIIKAMKYSTTDEKCPDCRVIAKRIISGSPGFVLKGEGFHQNDYKKNDRK